MHGKMLPLAVRVIAGDRPVNLRQGEIVVAQPVRIDQHVVLLDVTSNGIDFGHSLIERNIGPAPPSPGWYGARSTLRLQGALAVIGMLEGY